MERALNLNNLYISEGNAIYSTAPAYNTSIIRSLFSFEGRYTRFDYWVKGFIPANVLLLLMFFIPRSFWPDGMSSAFFLFVLIVSSWIAFAAGVKRFHDRGIAGGYILFAFIPIANLIVLLQIGFLDGVPGPNIYGQDPKGRPQFAPVEG